MPKASVNVKKFAISKELIDKISSKGRITVQQNENNGIVVGLEVLKTIDTKFLAEHGLQVMLVPIEKQTE